MASSKTTSRRSNGYTIISAVIALAVSGVFGALFYQIHRLEQDYGHLRVEASDRDLLVRQIAELSTERRGLAEAVQAMKVSEIRLAELEDEIARRSASVDSLVEREAEARSVLASRDQADVNLGAAKLELTRLGNDIEEHRTTIERLAADQRGLEDAVVEATGRRDRALNDAKRAETERTALQIAVADLTAQRAEAQRLEEAVRRLGETSARLDTEAQAREKRRDEAALDLARLETQIATASTSLATIRDDLTAGQADHAALSEELATLGTAKAGLDRDMGTLTARLKEAEAVKVRLDALRTETAEAEVQLSKVVADRTEAETALQSRRVALAALGEQTQVAQARLEAVKQTLAAAEAQAATLEGLEARVQDQRLALAQLTAERDTVRADVADASAHLATLQARSALLSATEDQVTQASLRLDTLRAELSETDQKAQKMREELASLSAELDQARANRAAALATQQEATRMTEEARAHRDNLLAEISTLEGQRADLVEARRTADALRVEVSALQVQRDTINAEISNLNTQATELQPVEAAKPVGSE